MQYGEWTIIKEVERDKNNGLKRYLCRCSCGTERVVREDKLKCGKSKSCGHLDYSLQKILNGKPGSSGVRGVRWNKKDQKWEANMTRHGERMYLGQYDDLEDARQARLNAEQGLLREVTSKQK